MKKPTQLQSVKGGNLLGCFISLSALEGYTQKVFLKMTSHSGQIMKSNMPQPDTSAV